MWNGKLKTVLGIICVCVFISTLFYDVATQQFHTITLLSNEVQITGTVIGTKTGEASTGQRDNGPVLKVQPIRQQDGSTKSQSSTGSKFTNTIELKIVGHKGFATGSEVQDMIKYAYKVGGYNLVALIECENGSWNIKQQSNVVYKGRREMSFGLCQIMNRVVPNDWKGQIDQCRELRSSGTPFYGPTRIIKGEYCYKYVSNRFIYSE